MARRVLLTADRYLDAARTMRPRQLVMRPRRLLPPVLFAAPTPSKDVWNGLATGLGVERAPPSGPHPPPETDGIFRAVGHARGFPRPGFWTDAEDGLLFLFQLHGFAELARYAAGPRSDEGDSFWERVLWDWLRTNSRPKRVAWHPYPMSGRLIAWCAALSARRWDVALERQARASMRRQLVVLRRTVEHDVGGNHVLRNGFALVVASVCLGDARSEAAGSRLLASELPRQLLSDGGHEERSTAYHRELLERAEDTISLLERAGRTLPRWLMAAVDQMRGWLNAVAGPRGDLPLLNDAWDGPPIALSPRGTMSDLNDSGYVVLRHQADQVLIDVGPFAPRHLPPHGHADALSFVLWIDGAPLIVDRGSFTYSGPDRGRFRGTAAHNTVTVAGIDQCDLWAPFRAAHTPDVRRLGTQESEGTVTLTAEHDGYKRVGVIHRRTFVWLPGAGVVVVDRLLGRPRDACSRLHLKPGIDAQGSRVGPLEVRPLGEGGPTVMEDELHAPFLGVSVPARVMARTAPATPGVPFGWALLRPGSRAQLLDGRLLVELPQGGRVSAIVG